MASITHTFVEQNTNQSSGSATYVDVTGGAITSGNFTAGKKYLLYITAQVNESGASSLSTRVVHGSTAFDASEITRVATNVGTTRAVYTYMTVWTAVSSEDVKLQFSVGDPSVNMDQIAMLAMNLSDSLTENTDWFYNESTTDQALSTTASDGASVTFTPGIAGHDWAVLTYTNYDSSDSSTFITSRLERSGEASSTVPSATIRAHSSAHFYNMQLARVFNLGTSSNTFKEVSVSSATSHTRLHSALFAFNLNKFKDHIFAYTAATTNLDFNDFNTLVQTASLTPTVASDVVILSYWGYKTNDTTQNGKMRIQVDSVDQPAGQTTDNYALNYSAGTSDIHPMMQLTMVSSMTAAAHTIHADGSTATSTGTPVAQERTIIAFTTELAAGGWGPLLGSSNNRLVVST